MIGNDSQSTHVEMTGASTPHTEADVSTVNTQANEETVPLERNSFGSSNVDSSNAMTHLSTPMPGLARQNEHYDGPSERSAHNNDGTLTQPWNGHYPPSTDTTFSVQNSDGALAQPWNGHYPPATVPTFSVQNGDGTLAQLWNGEYPLVSGTIF